MNLLKTNAAKLNIELSDFQIGQFELFYKELILWNKQLNLTTITGYEDVQINHFLDSLTLMPHLEDMKSDNIVDVGSGAGFPGIPLKIVLPEIRLALIESRRKKVEFISNIQSRLGLNQVSILQGRAEHFGRHAEHREHYDVAVTRAVGGLPVVLEYTLPLCSIDGFSICYRTIPGKDELEMGKHAAGLLGGVLHGVFPAYNNTDKDSRALVIFRKVSPTPQKYPRKSGLPSKRPL